MLIDNSLFNISKGLFPLPLSDFSFLGENPEFNEESSEILLPESRSFWKTSSCSGFRE